MDSYPYSYIYIYIMCMDTHMYMHIYISVYMMGKPSTWLLTKHPLDEGESFSMGRGKGRVNPPLELKGFEYLGVALSLYTL